MYYYKREPQGLVAAGHDVVDRLEQHLLCWFVVMSSLVDCFVWVTYIYI